MMSGESRMSLSVFPWAAAIIARPTSTVEVGASGSTVVSGSSLAIPGMGEEPVNVSRMQCGLVSFLIFLCVGGDCADAEVQEASS